MTFNKVQKLDEVAESVTMVQDAQGLWVESTITVSLYRCEGMVRGSKCNLVWDRWGLAKDCLDNGHKNQVWQQYKDQRYVRAAVRRDGPRPAPAQAPVPSPAPQARAQVPSLADVRAMALAHGYLLRKKPEAKATAVDTSEVTE